jgi:hypothetical protein
VLKENKNRAKLGKRYGRSRLNRDGMNDYRLLARIPREYISAGSRSVPDVRTSTREFQQAVVNVAGVGTVRFTYKRVAHKKKAHSPHFFWTVWNAEMIERPPPSDEQP